MEIMLRFGLIMLMGLLLAQVSAQGDGGPRSSAENVDIAPFARVRTWDPHRMDGARNGRTEAFKADELFLGTDLFPDKEGNYSVPEAKDGTSCIGLEWLERRHLNQVVVRFASPSAMAPSAHDAQLQYWSGVSSWQGEWKPCKGSVNVHKNGGEWVFDIDWAGNDDGQKGTLKVRWVIPASKEALSMSMLAYTVSEWDKAELVLQPVPPLPGKTGKLEIYNGELVGDNKDSVHRTWDMGSPLKLAVRYSKGPHITDRTVIRLQLPNAAFGVAVDDIIANGCVYAPDLNFFASDASAKMTLDAYKKKIAGETTVLDAVRHLPDQTFDKAMQHVHRPDADLGPTLLSLACDNHKFLLSRDGSIEYSDADDFDKYLDHYLQCDCCLKPEFGSGKSTSTTRRLDDGWMPMPIISVDDNGVIYQQRTFVAPYDKSAPSAKMSAWYNSKPLCVAEFTFENRSDKPVEVKLGLKMFKDPKKTELADVKSWERGAMFVKNGRPVALVDTATFSPGLTGKAADGGWMISGTVAPNSRSRCVAYMPGWDASKEIASIKGDEDLASITKDYWHKVMAPAMHVNIPDHNLMNIIYASQVHCLLAARNEDKKNVAAWIASTCYGPLESEAHSVIRGMQFMGQTDFAQRSFEYFIKRYNADGFLTTGYTVMGTGWHLWTLGEYYKLTRDTKWLEGHASEIVRVCKWIMAQREKTKKLDSRGEKVPEYGLMPPGVMADWGVYSYYFYMNGYYCAGLSEIGKALADIGDPNAKEIFDAAEDLKADIMRAFHLVQAQAPLFKLRDGTWVPEYPTQVYCPMPTKDLYPGDDGNRSWCYDVELGTHHLVPMGVMDPASSDAKWMMNHMEDVQFLSNGWFYYPAAQSEKDWFNLGGFAKVQPYYARTVEVYGLQDDVKPFVRSYFNSVCSLLNREDLSLWEHFMNGAFNKTHETGYFLYETSEMFVTEHYDTLCIAPFITNNWMKQGMKVEVRDAPTSFGKISYKITSHVDEGYIQAVIEKPSREWPVQMMVRLRHPEGKKMKSVSVNGKTALKFNASGESVLIDMPEGERLTVRGHF